MRITLHRKENEYKSPDYAHAQVFVNIYTQICICMYIPTFSLSVSYTIDVLLMQKYNCHSRAQNGFSG